MKRSAIPTWSFVIVLLAWATVRADEDKPSAAYRPQSLHDSFSGKSWATVVSDAGGYRLRLLTEEEKASVEKTLNDYRQARGQGNVAEALSTEYRAMPSDVRGGRFYRFRQLLSDAVELKNDELHAVLPWASVSVVLLGPSGSFGSAGRFDQDSAARGFPPPTQEFIQGLRDRRQRSSDDSTAGDSTTDDSTTDAAGGLLGAVRNIGKESDDTPHIARPSIYFLEYADAKSVLDVIDRLYGDRDLRIAIEPRLNAIIVQCEEETVKQIEQLVEALDRQSVHEPDEPTETPTLRAYSLDDSDATTVVQVLQTVLAGTPGVRLSVDIKANRIIVLGHAADHETVKATIEQLESEK